MGPLQAETFKSAGTRLTQEVRVRPTDDAVRRAVAAHEPLINMSGISDK